MHNTTYYLYLLSTHRHVIDCNLMKMLLESLVLSHLSYCVTVWGPSLGSTLLQRLQRMQNRAVRLCCNLRKHDHVSAFYHQLNWLPLSCFIQFKSLCLMYCQYHHFKCIPLEPPIAFGRASSYCTRTPVYFANIPMFRLSLPQRFFRFRATQWCHFQSLIISIVHILHMWMPLDSTVIHCIDYHDYCCLFYFCCILAVFVELFCCLFICFLQCSYLVFVFVCVCVYPILYVCLSSPPVRKSGCSRLSGG